MSAPTFKELTLGTTMRSYFNNLNLSRLHVVYFLTTLYLTRCETHFYVENPETKHPKPPYHAG